MKHLNKFGIVLGLLVLLLTGCTKPGETNTELVGKDSQGIVTEQQETTPQETTPQETTPQETTPQTENTTQNQAEDEILGTTGFQVSGTELLDANGNPFVMKGINHAHTWYKGELTRALDTTVALGANTIRIVLSDGQQWEKDSLESVKALIEECKQRKLITVLEVHDVTGSNRIEDLEKVCEYWIEIKEAFIGNEDYVILNIANEWYGDWKTKKWAEGYKTVIPMLREAGIKNTIMVDSAGWGQYPKSIIEAGQEVFASDPDQNTMFSVHMYEYSGKDAKTVTNTMEDILEQELCFIIGEFGQKHTNGTVAFETILEESERLQVGYLGWSLKGNSGGVEYLDIALDWDGKELSADWGEPLVNGPYGIKNTAKTASVFHD